MDSRRLQLTKVELVLLDCLDQENEGKGSMSEQDSDMKNSLESAAMNRDEVKRMRDKLSFQNRKRG